MMWPFPFVVRTVVGVLTLDIFLASMYYHTKRIQRMATT